MSEQREAFFGGKLKTKDILDYLKEIKAPFRQVRDMDADEAIEVKGGPARGGARLLRKGKGWSFITRRDKGKLRNLGDLADVVDFFRMKAAFCEGAGDVRPVLAFVHALDVPYFVSKNASGELTFDLNEGPAAGGVRFVRVGSTWHYQTDEDQGNLTALLADPLPDSFERTARRRRVDPKMRRRMRQISRKSRGKRKRKAPRPKVIEKTPKGLKLNVDTMTFKKMPVSKRQVSVGGKKKKIRSLSTRDTKEYKVFMRHYTKWKKKWQKKFQAMRKKQKASALRGLNRRPRPGRSRRASQDQVLFNRAVRVAYNNPGPVQDALCPVLAKYAGAYDNRG